MYMKLLKFELNDTNTFPSKYNMYIGTSRHMYILVPHVGVVNSETFYLLLLPD